jgi:hypothetical protein
VLGRACAGPGHLSRLLCTPGYTTDVTAPTIDEADDSAVAGREESEAFDRRLRQIEAQERDDLIRGVGNPEGGRPSTEYQPALDVGRLKTRMEELVAFRSAVQESFVWRAAQAVRRLFGRAW